MKTCTHPNIVPFYGVVSAVLRTDNHVPELYIWVATAAVAPQLLPPPLQLLSPNYRRRSSPTGG